MVITHEMKVVERICSRVAIIADSRIAECGDVREVFRRPRTQAGTRAQSGGPITRHMRRR